MHWRELRELDDADRRRLLASPAGESLCAEALAHPDSSEFQLAFEYFSAYPYVVKPYTFTWLKRYWALERGTADRVAGFDMPALRWLVACARGVPDVASHIVVEGEHRELLRFALACAEQEPFGNALLERVVANYLAALPGRFAFEGLVPLSALQTGALELLRSRPHPIAHWERVTALCDGGPEELFVRAALNYCGQDFRSRGLDALASAPKSARQILECSPPPSLSAEGQIVGALFLCATCGESWQELPSHVRSGLSMDLCSGSEVDIASTSQALGKIPELARDLVGHYLKEQRAVAVIATLGDPPLLRQLVAALEGNTLDAGTIGDALSQSLAAVEVLLETVGPQSRSPLALLAVRCVAQRPDAEVVSWLVRLLEHPAATVVTAASRKLSAIGRRPRLRTLVQRAIAAPPSVASAKGDALRGAVARRLPQDHDASTPLSRVARRAGDLAKERRAFLKLCERLKGQEDRWASELSREVQRLGAVALHWLREELQESIRHGQTRLWCFAVATLASDSDAVWVAVESFASLPKVKSAFWARPARALAGAGSLLAEPIAYVLRHQDTEHVELLFRLLAKHAHRDATGLFVLGLSHVNKAVRLHSVDGLSRLQQGPLVEVSLALRAGEPGTRIAAAELLAIWARRESGEALQDALAKERSARVRPYLQDALVSVLGTRGLLGRVPKGATAAAWSDFLEREPEPATLPAFLRHEAPPTLLWRDGSCLSARAELGFLARVMQLDTSLKGRLVRAMTAELESKALASWSRFIHERWARAKDTRHKWAVLQLWVLSSEDDIDAVGYSLSRLRANEYVALSAYLKVLQWHRSFTAQKWLLYWAERLPSRGVREQARELVDRVAYKAKLAPRELRAKADWAIAARALVAELLTAELTPLLRYRLVRLFERSFRDGLAFSLDTLVDLRRRFSDVVDPLIFELPDGRIKLGGSLSRKLRGLDNQARNIRLAHPLRVTPATMTALPGFANVPFLDQVGRATFVAGGDPDLCLSALDTDSEHLGRWRVEQGWFHGEPMDHGVVHSNFLRLPGAGVVAELRHTGYPIGARDWVEDVAITGLIFLDLEGDELDAESVDPVAYSEICRSVCLLREVGER